jgi:hypothetical protein
MRYRRENGLNVLSMAVPLSQEVTS